MADEVINISVNIPKDDKIVRWLTSQEDINISILKLLNMEIQSPRLVDTQSSIEIIKREFYDLDKLIKYKTDILTMLYLKQLSSNSNKTITTTEMYANIISKYKLQRFTQADICMDVVVLDKIKSRVSQSLIQLRSKGEISLYSRATYAITEKGYMTAKIMNRVV